MRNENGLNKEPKPSDAPVEPAGQYEPAEQEFSVARRDPTGQKNPALQMPLGDERPFSKQYEPAVHATAAAEPAGQ